MDLKHGIVKVIVESLDDLWTLYNVVEKGDLVYARTSREVKMEDIGRPSSRRVPVSLELKAEKVFFDKAVNRLRIHGVVTKAPEELNIQGAHHTINLKVEDSVTIVKEFWHNHQLERMKKAVAEQEPITIVAIDQEECCIATLRAYGVDVKSELRSSLPGKLEYEKREEAMKKYLNDVVKFLASVPKPQRDKIVIVGPGLTKDAFLKFIKEHDPEIASSIEAVKGVSSGGISGVNESLRSGIISKVVKEARAAKETMLVEEVLARLGASRGNVSFGLEEVEKDAFSGAVQTLLVCDQALREADEEERKRIEGIMRAVESKGGKVMVISSEHEGGQKLISLGRVAALLRYAKHWT